MNPRRITLSALAAGLLVLLVSPARADLVFIEASANGALIPSWYNPIDAIGDENLTGHGLVEDFAWSVEVALEAGSSQTTGRRRYQPMTIRVRMSAAITQVALAIKNNAVVNASVVTFERDAIDGSLVKRITYVLEQARLTSLKIYTVEESGEPTTYADLGIIATTWGIEDAVTGLSFEDSWDEAL